MEWRARERWGERVPAPRARAAGAARPHLPSKAPATHPSDVPLRPSLGFRSLFRPLRNPVVTTAPLAAAVAAVLAAAAAAARVRSHAHRRGRARASARWRHLATDRRRTRGIRGFRAPRSPQAGFAAFPHPPDLLLSAEGGPRVWLPCRHLASGKSRHHTSLYGVTDFVTADGKVQLARRREFTGRRWWEEQWPRPDWRPNWRGPHSLFLRRAGRFSKE